MTASLCVYSTRTSGCVVMLCVCVCVCLYCSSGDVLSVLMFILFDWPYCVWYNHVCGILPPSLSLSFVYFVYLTFAMSIVLQKGVNLLTIINSIMY